MAPVPGRTLRCPAKVDTDFAIGSILRLQVLLVPVPRPKVASVKNAGLQRAHGEARGDEPEEAKDDAGVRRHS